MFSALFRFFIYSNIFIAICAVLMVDQTSRFILNQQTNISLTGFVFFSTLCSYSFHWHLTSHSVIPSPRIEWLQRNRSIHLVLFIVGLIGAGYFFLHLLPFWHWLLIAAFVTFLYSAPKIPNKYFRALRKVALGKTIFLAFVWMYVTSILPVIVSGQGWHDQFILFAISRFFLIYAICILFDYRDRQDDKAAGIRSLITWLSEKNISMLFTFSLIVFVTSCLLLLQFNHNLLSVSLLIAPGVITGSLYNYARRNFSDMLYYFVLDGLMALSAMLTLFAGI